MKGLISAGANSPNDLYVICMTQTMAGLYMQPLSRIHFLARNEIHFEVDFDEIVPPCGSGIVVHKETVTNCSV